MDPSQTASVAWLVSNVKTNDHQELFDTELASSRLRAGVCISGCLQAGRTVLPLNFREAHHDPALVFMAKYVPDSHTGQFLDDSGARWGIWLDKIKALHKKGRPLVVDYTDHHFTNPNIVGEFYRTIKPYISGLVVPSERMRRHVQTEWDGPLAVIPEPVEVPACAVDRSPASEKMALWFGHNSNLPYLFQFLASPAFHQSPPDRLVILTNHALADMIKPGLVKAPAHLKVSLAKWSLPTMRQIASQCHYAIVPSDVDDQRKNGASPGRLLTSLMLGLPVVATPLEAYLPFSDYFAAIGSEQASALMTKPALGHDQVLKAQPMIQSQYSMSAIGQQWAVLADFYLN